MTPLSVAHTELRLYVAQVESAHRALERAIALRQAAGEPAPFDAWEDLRTAALAQLWETLDRIEPGLGLRLMKALYAVFEPGDEEPLPPLPLPLPQVFDDAWPVPFGGTADNAGAGFDFKVGRGAPRS